MLRCCYMGTLMYYLQRFCFASALGRPYTMEANYSASERLNGISQLPGIRGVVQEEAPFVIGGVGINTIAQDTCAKFKFTM